METCINFKPLVLLVLFLHDPLEQSLRKNRIGVHLSVYQMELTSRYNSISSASAALSIMKSKWGGSSWPNSKVDLVHAVLGKAAGGGVAYVGSLCNTGYGFGVSTGLTGSYKSMNNAMVWDSMVFAHELG